MRKDVLSMFLNIDNVVAERMSVVNCSRQPD